MVTRDVLLSQEYKDYLQSKRWLRLRAAVFKRDGYRCVICNSNQDLQCHHRTYKRIFKERMSDLTTLCGSCHNVVTNILRGRRRNYKPKPRNVSYW